MALPVIAAGAGMSIAGGLLAGRRKKPNIDIAGMENTARQGAMEQRGIADALRGGLDTGRANYRDEADRLGLGIQKDLTKLGENYGANINRLGDVDKLQTEAMKRQAQERAHRNVPQQQQMIREALASSGGMRTGAAGRALMQPGMQAAQQSADFASEADIAQLGRTSARQRDAVDAVYTSAAGARLERLGLDKQTLQTLFDSGRHDLIQHAAQMAGISQQLTNDLLGIHGTKANVAIADAAGANQRNQMIGQILGNLGGRTLAGGMGA